MKPSQALVEALSDLKRIEEGGDTRRVTSEMLLALARKEISATDVEAAAKIVAAASMHKMVDLKTAQWAHKLREQAAALTVFPSE